MESTSLDDFIKSDEQRRLFEQERLILEVTDRICELMEAKNMTRKKLAETLNKSKGFVSQALDGTQNLTLRTVADLFAALECRAEVRAVSLHVTPNDRKLVYSANFDEELEYGLDQRPMSVTAPEFEGGDRDAA